MNEQVRSEVQREEAMYTVVEFNPSEATASQQEDILSLHRALRGENASDSYGALVARDFQKCRLFVAEDAEHHIYAMMLLGMKDGEYWIYHNVVSADAAGQGLGKRMLETVINAAKQKGARQIFLHCKPIQERDAARAVYQSFGFQNLGQDPAEQQRVEKFVLTLQ